MSIRHTMSALGAMVLSLLLAGTVDAAPYQELEAREGYVPVYIREGDTPLFEINPKLAEAFNEIDTKNFIEQADVEPVLEKKQELILMTADNGNVMLIAEPADQIMSENEPAPTVDIEPAPVFESQDEIAENDDKSGNVDKPEEAEEAPVKPSEEQLEEAKEALEEFVDVLAGSLLDKLNLPAVVDEEKSTTELVVEARPKVEDDNLNEQSADGLNNDDVRESARDVRAEEPASDVSTVDAFKTKDIVVKSDETDKIDSTDISLVSLDTVSE